MGGRPRPAPSTGCSGRPCAGWLRSRSSSASAGGCGSRSAAAPRLSATVARFFVGLGLPLTEGYGLTEAAPVVSNIAPEGFRPGWVGIPLPGVEVRLGAQDELYVRGPNVCLGYWGDAEATAAAIDAEGWLHTGDVATLADGYVGIRGRLKEILVTSTGQKVPPADMEMALTMEPLFDQAMVVGEGRPYLAALLVLAPEPWARLAGRLGLDPDDPARWRTRGRWMPPRPWWTSGSRTSPAMPRCVPCIWGSAPGPSRMG